MLLELYLMHLMAEAAKAHLTDDLSVRAREEEERRRLAGQPIVIAAREEVNAIIANPVMVGMSPAQALVASGAKKEGDLKGMSEDDIREQVGCAPWFFPTFLKDLRALDPRLPLPFPLLTPEPPQLIDVLHTSGMKDFKEVKMEEERWMRRMRRELRAEGCRSNPFSPPLPCSSRICTKMI